MDISFCSTKQTCTVLSLERIHQRSVKTTTLLFPMEDSKQNRDRRDSRSRGSGGSRGGHGGRAGQRDRGEYRRDYRDRTAREPDTIVVPILRYGTNSNFLKFKEKLSRLALKDYKDLGRIIEDMEYYEPPEIDEDDYDLDNDPRGVKLQTYKDELKERSKSIRDMRNNRSSLYAMIEMYLSKESLDEVRQHDNYDDFNANKDPLELWKAITEIHRVMSVSKVATVVKQTAKDNFDTCYQHTYESIVDFKQRYTDAHEAYDSFGNPMMEGKDIAVHFMNRLDSARYAQFRVDTINDIAAGKMKQPKSLNDMYLLAKERLVVKRDMTYQGISTSFATADDTRQTY